MITPFFSAGRFGFDVNVATVSEDVSQVIEGVEFRAGVQTVGH